MANFKGECCAEECKGCYVYFANLSKHSKEQRKTLYKMASIMFNKDFGGKVSAPTEGNVQKRYDGGNRK